MGRTRISQWTSYRKWTSLLDGVLYPRRDLIFDTCCRRIKCTIRRIRTRRCHLGIRSSLTPTNWQLSAILPLWPCIQSGYKRLPALDRAPYQHRCKSKRSKEVGRKEFEYIYLLRFECTKEITKKTASSNWTIGKKSIKKKLKNSRKRPRIF